MERLRNVLRCLRRPDAERGDDPHTAVLYTSPHVEKAELAVSAAAQKPDGGYGWLIVFASFLAHLTLYGVCWSVGMFNVLFLETFHQSSSATAWVGSLLNALMNASGLLSSALVSRFGCRPVLLAGGLLAASGIALAALSQRLLHVYLTFSGLGGVGLGVAYIPAVVIVSQWFQRRRTIAFGIAVSGAGLGGFVFPPIIGFLTENCSWRACLLCLAAIVLVGLTIAGALMAPPPAESGNLAALTTTDDGCSQLSELKESVSLMLSLPMMLLSVNNFLFCFGQVVVYVHLGAFSLSAGLLGYSGTDLVFSVIGVANMLGRVVHGLLCHFPSLASLLLYLVSSGVAGAAVLLITACHSVTSLAVCAALFGFASCCQGVLMPDIIISLVGERRLAVTYGLLMLPEGVGFMLGGPVAGLLYDASGRYGFSFLLAGGSLVLSALLLLVPWWCVPAALAPPTHTHRRQTTELQQPAAEPCLTAKTPADPADFRTPTPSASEDEGVVLDIDLGEAGDDVYDNVPFWMPKYCTPLSNDLGGKEDCEEEVLMPVHVYKGASEKGKRSISPSEGGHTNASTILTNEVSYTSPMSEDEGTCTSLISEDEEGCVPLMPAMGEPRCEVFGAVSERLETPRQEEEVRICSEEGHACPPPDLKNERHSPALTSSVLTATPPLSGRHTVETAKDRAVVV